MTDVDREAERGLLLVPIRAALLWTAGGAVALLIVITGAAFLALGLPGVEQKRQLTIADLFDLLKLTFAITGGLGAVVALVMAYRRQRVAEAANGLAEAANRLAEAAQEHRRKVDEATQAHQERTASDARLDAAERRVTELYATAADQLGSVKAPVRLAGLYALERLAQSNPEHRQTVVNVLCAYLRMPYELPGADGEDTRREEREVRVTAQRILATHLRAAEDGTASPEEADSRLDFWPAIALDLTGATLVDLDFHGVQVRGAGFAGATFYGVTRFDRAAFHDRAHFDRATFHGAARFEEATFHRAVQFVGAALHGRAHFDGASFTRRTDFTEATFHVGVVFARAVFSRAASFAEAVFRQECSFETATFGGPAVFGATRFHGGCSLQGVAFRGYADFLRTTFTQEASFAWATFHDGVRFDTVTFGVPANLDRAAVADLTGSYERTWPPEWTVRAADAGRGLLRLRAS